LHNISPITLPYLVPINFLKRVKNSNTINTMQILDSNSNHYGNPLVTGNRPLTRRFSFKCDDNISTKFLKSKANHFGNPLVTGECPLARKFSTKCDGDSSKYNNNDMYLQQEFRVATSPGSRNSGAIYQDNMNIVSPTFNLTSTTSSVSSDFSTTIPSEADSTHCYYHNRSSSYDSASIGLPSSYYPVGQDASSNFEDIILEELQDFDELFGSSSSKSTVYSLDGTEHESISIIQDVFVNINGNK